MIPLSQMTVHSKGRISSISKSELHESLQARLMEMGFLENEIVEVVNIAPWGRDPIAVRVRGTTVALRKSEAALILVEVASG